MPNGKKQSQVVVTFREAQRILTGMEAVKNIPEAARRDTAASPVEKAAAMAAVGQALNQMQKAENEAGAMVLTTPQHGPAARLQSLIASGEAASLEFEPLPTGGLEAKFDTHDWFGWATVAWAKLKNPTPHKMLRPTGDPPGPFPDAGRIAVLGDWGTGLYGAPKIADAVRCDRDPFAMLLHLGDVDHAGTDSEITDRFLDVWPYRNEAINRALNSNHEMFSGGAGYFGKTLPKFGQESSYFALQNKHWILIGLDVAYHDHAIDDEQVDWLKRVLAQAGARKAVLFSHHQLYSHFESQGTKLWSHPDFGEILRSRRIFAWYWGHEHRCSIFESADANFGILARCIGHSGMPQSRKATRNLPQCGEKEYNQAEWRRSVAKTVEGNPLPNVVVLDGPNNDIQDESDKFSPHGYAVLTLDGPALREEIRDLRKHHLRKNTVLNFKYGSRRKRTKATRSRQPCFGESPRA